MGRDEQRHNPDKRRYPRHEFEAEIGVSSSDGLWTPFFSKNISKGGIFIVTHDPLPVGSQVVLKLTVPPLSQPVVVNGTVRWIREFRHDIDEQVPGMGVQFAEELPDEVITALQKFPAERAPVFDD